MQKEKNVVESPEHGGEKMDVAPVSPPSRRRSVGQDSESLLVALAWLIIEGAVLFRRVRGILARI
jgi:hypothetical protein